MMEEFAEDDDDDGDLNVHKFDHQVKRSNWLYVVMCSSVSVLDEAQLQLFFFCCHAICLPFVWK